MPRIVVSGRVTDTADGELTEGDIESLIIDGREVTVDSETAVWRTRIDLPAGETSVEIVLTDSAGVSDTYSLDFLNRNPARALKYLALSEDASKLLVSGDNLLREFDTLNHAERIISRNYVPTSGWDSRYIRLSPYNDNAIVVRDLENSGDAYTIDVTDGTGESLGPVPTSDISGPGVIDLDVGVETLAYTSSLGRRDSMDAKCELKLMDLASGESRSVFDGGFQPLYPPSCYEGFCSGPVLLDEENNRALVATWSSIPSGECPDGLEGELLPFHGLYSIDLSTGERRAVSNRDIGSGPEAGQIARLFHHVASDKVIAIERTKAYEIDLESGDRQLITDQLVLPRNDLDMAYDKRDSKLYVSHDNRRITRIDLITGEQETFINELRNVGSGPDISSINGVLDPRGNRLLIAERGDQLLQIKLDTLHRSVVIPASGIEDDLSSAHGETLFTKPGPLDEDSYSLYYYQRLVRTVAGSLSASVSVHRVDLTSGQRELISSSERGAGEEMKFVRSVNLDRDRGLLYVTGELAGPTEGSTGIIAIDIASGDRHTLAVAERDTVQLQRSVYASNRDTLITATAGAGILEIDASTGEIQVLHAPVPGRSEFYIETVRDLSWDGNEESVVLGGDWRFNAQSISLNTGDRTLIDDVTGSFIYDASSDVYFVPGVRAISGYSGEEVIISASE